MLFSDWHATAQALQPVQTERSIDMPHLWPAYSFSVQSETSAGWWMPWWSTKSGWSR